MSIPTHWDVDVINQIVEHRLKQNDIRQFLRTLNTENEDEFISKIAEVLGKIVTLLEVSRRVSNTLSLDTLLDHMIQLTADALNADRCTLFLHDPEPRELFSRVALGDLKQEIRFPDHQGIAGSVFTNREAIIIHDAYADPRFNQEVDRKTGYRTRNILCAPIRSRENKIIGVVQVLNKSEGRFNTDDLTLLEAITSQASSALQNAQLFEQVQRARQEETHLLEVTTAISSELHLEPLLFKIMQTTSKMLQADRSTLFLHDEKEDQLWSLVAEGMETQQIRFPSHMGIAGNAFKTEQTINIVDAYSDPRFNPEVDKKTGYRTKSILCMPVITKEGKAIGVIQALNKKGGPFTKVDEKRLRAFSAQASIAIENAKLFDDVLNMKNYNESILHSMSNGVITLDADHRIAKCNDAAVRILQTDEDHIIEQPVDEYFAGPNRWVVDSVKRVLETESADITLDTALFIDDNQISINLTVVPLRNAKEEHIGSMLLLEDITREKRIKGTMARYMTKEVAEKLLEESAEAALGGQLQLASVLFSDIRDFTTVAETMDSPQEIVSLLNDYFTIMVDIIFEHGGVLDKYIGDAIMAVFGAPITTGEDADRALKTGLDMLTALHEFNQKAIAEGRMPLNIGIGINTAEVLSGNIGSLKRMDYTVIGDGVNLASRLEGANKFYGTHILISEQTFDVLKDNYIHRLVDRIRVKGKAKPAGIYEILDYHSEQSFPNIEAVLAAYNEGLTCYQGRDWEAALRKFEKALELNSKDCVSQIYLQRCRHFMQNPPPEDWDGVWKLQEK